jgi:hypothetical protein
LCCLFLTIIFIAFIFRALIDIFVVLFGLITLLLVLCYVGVLVLMFLSPLYAVWKLGLHLYHSIFANDTRKYIVYTVQCIYVPITVNIV